MKYSPERKEAILKKMQAPEAQSIPKLAKAEGIGESTLYKWRQQARQQGRLLPDSTPQGWSSQDKLAAVLETAILSEAEIAQYCRQRGLYPAQIQQWRQACECANGGKLTQAHEHDEQLREQRKQVRHLERELAHKDKALAETAALLVLRKKAQAIWGDNEDA